MIKEFNFDSYEDAVEFLSCCSHNDVEEMAGITLNHISIIIDGDIDEIN